MGLILASFQCSDDDALVTLGKPIHRYNEYKNALQFANEAELEEYNEINNRIQDKINHVKEELRNVMKEQIHSMGIIEKRDEYETESQDLKKQEECLLEELQTIEEKIKECAEECKRKIVMPLKEVSSGKGEIREIYEKVKAVDLEQAEYEDFNGKKGRIESIVQMVEQAFEAAIKIKKESPCYQKLEELKGKQKTLQAEVEENRKQLESIKARLGDVVAKVNSIVKEFKPAFEQLEDGDYDLAYRMINH